ncbi:hypothetical protein [Asticcacaulis solisilvae]|uniref:hypothetical protein n=1 Tax=Asticcacaulis solisilvae TaxID=1217274 RepID=UPI003FD787E4
MDKAYLMVSAAVLTLAAPAAYAQDSVANVSKAVGDSAAATAELSEAGVKLTVGAVSVPVVAVGSVAATTGIVLTDAGLDSLKFANSPLEISPETVVAQPAPRVPHDAQAPAPQKKTRP